MLRFQNGNHMRQESFDTGIGLRSRACFAAIGLIKLVYWYQKSSLPCLGILVWVNTMQGTDFVRHAESTRGWVTSKLHKIKYLESDKGSYWLSLISNQWVTIKNEINSFFQVGNFFRMCNFFIFVQQISKFGHLLSTFLCQSDIIIPRSPRRFLWSWANNVELQYQITLTWIR